MDKRFGMKDKEAASRQERRGLLRPPPAAWISLDESQGDQAAASSSQGPGSSGAPAVGYGGAGAAGHGGDAAAAGHSGDTGAAGQSGSAVAAGHSGAGAAGQSGSAVAAGHSGAGAAGQSGSAVAAGHSGAGAAGQSGSAVAAGHSGAGAAGQSGSAVAAGHSGAGAAGQSGSAVAAGHSGAGAAGQSGSAVAAGHSGAGAAGHSGGATAPRDSNAPKDWKTRGLLATVKSGDNKEIKRLVGRVDTRLHAAARAQDLTALCALLGAGAAPDALDWEGRTPLHLCVVLRLMEPFRVLLSVAGSADARDASGWPLLHAALLHGWRAGARAALTAGARVDATGPGRIYMHNLSPDHIVVDDYLSRYPKIRWTVFLDSLPRTVIEVAMIADMEMFEPILTVARARGVIDCLNTEGTTALHTASWLGNQPAVDALLKSGASPHRVSEKKKKDTSPEDGLAPEHTAVYNKNQESVVFPNSAQVKTEDGNTPQNLDAVRGDETAEANGQGETSGSAESPDVVLDRVDTALHAAVHNPETLKLFLDTTKVTSSLNEEGFAPEHIAVNSKNLESLKLLLDKFDNTLLKTGDRHENTLLHLAAMRGGDEAANIILGRDIGHKTVTAMFEVNAHGETPLHLAAKYNNREMTALLLLNGANLSTVTTKPKDHKESQSYCRTTVLELISKTFYNSVNFFELLFDGFIYNVDGNSIQLDYDVLTDGKDMSQIKVLEEFVRCGRSKVLIHPLIESLLYLKWKHFEPLFIAMLCIYGMFLVPFNTLMIYIFYSEDKSNNNIAVNTTSNSSLSDALMPGSDCCQGGVYWLLIVMTYISIFILMLQECLFVYLKKLRHFASVESWVKLCGLVLCAGAPLAALAPGAWPRHAACAALLLAWLQAMFLVSRFSRWGYYVLMLGKVAVNILKMLGTAIFLVIAFASCFFIQYRLAPPFDGPFAAFVKTLVMMSSEFEYENLFKEHKDQLEDTETIVRILFMLFVIVVAIVLMNFMIGVAVSDISELSETGNIRRLEKQVELLSTFEPLAYDERLGRWFIKLFGNKKYHKSMYTTRGNQSTWTVTVKEPAHTGSNTDTEDVTNKTQTSSSKLNDAIVETPSKQEQADQSVTVRDPAHTGGNKDVTYEIQISSSKLNDAIVETPSKQEQADKSVTVKEPAHSGSNEDVTYEIQISSSKLNDAIVETPSKQEQADQSVTVREPAHTGGNKDVTYKIQISSSKLYDAIVETPSKQEQADQDARRLNTEKPYRSWKNAFKLKQLKEKPGGANEKRGEDDDLINRQQTNFNTGVLKKHLRTLAYNSSKMTSDIENLTSDSEKMVNDIVKLNDSIEFLLRANLDMKFDVMQLTEILLEIERKLSRGPNETSATPRSSPERRSSPAPQASAERQASPAPVDNSTVENSEASKRL